MIRDVIAGLVAILLLLVAASLATTLQAFRRRRQRTRDSERALGRAIIAELPTSDDLVLVSEDDKRFYYGERPIDKNLIVAVRVLINGAPIAAYVSRRRSSAPPLPRSSDAEWGGAPRALDKRGSTQRDREAGAPGAIDEGAEAVAHDRWDVAVETSAGTIVVECGAIRERVSQELARTIFEAIKRDLEKRDEAATEAPRTQRS